MPTPAKPDASSLRLQQAQALLSVQRATAAIAAALGKLNDATYRMEQLLNLPISPKRSNEVDGQALVCIAYAEEKDRCELEMARACAAYADLFQVRYPYRKVRAEMNTSAPGLAS